MKGCCAPGSRMRPFSGIPIRKIALGDREASLKNVLFQEKLGSYYDKTQRVLALLPKVAPVLGQAGPIGGSGERGTFVQMRSDHRNGQGVYGSAGSCRRPVCARRGISGTGLARHLRTILPEVLECPVPVLRYRRDPGTAGSPGHGVRLLLRRPDPFGFRRSLCRPAPGKRHPKDHFRPSTECFAGLSDPMEPGDSRHVAPNQTAAELREFFEGRLRFLFEEMGFAYDCVNAVLAAGFDDPLDALERLRALQAMRDEPDFLSLASNFKRIVNIVAQAGQDGGDLEESLLQDPAELALWQGYLQRSARSPGRSAKAMTTALRCVRSHPCGSWSMNFLRKSWSWPRMRRFEKTGLPCCLHFAAFQQRRRYFQDRHRKGA